MRECVPRSAVAIIILNWNNAEDTLQCLASLARLTYPSYEVVVVDNGSADDSVQQIRAAHPEITLIETTRNLGYAGGNNVGIRHTLERGVKFVYIVNNDVTVTAGSLSSLLSVLRSDATIGVATPLIAVEHTPEYVWTLGSVISRRTGTVDRLHAGERVSDWRERLPFPVDAASGAAMVVKREVFQSVGLMDENFFLYYEETDWCLRVVRAGYRIMAVPSSIVFHKVSASLGDESPLIDYYMLRNHLRFVARNHSGVVCWLLQGRIVSRALMTIAAYTIKSRGGRRIVNRNARLLALRDALLGRWGKMGRDVEAVCYRGAGQ